MNGLFWVSLAGCQMTLLPLLLTDPSGLALTAASLGKVYMGMSVVQMISVPIVARFVDHVGKPHAIVLGSTLLSGSMAALPHCPTIGTAGIALATWSLGSSALSTAPVSLVSDVASNDADRSQAVALLRTSGDAGFLLGAVTMGTAADWLGGDLGLAMNGGVAVLVTATGWFMIRGSFSLPGR